MKVSLKSEGQIGFICASRMQCPEVVRMDCPYQVACHGSVTSSSVSIAIPQ